MSVAIPTTEPTSFTAGFTVKWTKAVAGYSPADGWALSYVLRDQAGSATNITITATDRTTDWSVTLTAAATAGYTPAVYDFLAYVTSGADKYLVDQGVLEILPDPTRDPANSRSSAQKILASLITAMESLATNKVDSYSANGRSYTAKDTDKLRRDIAFWRQTVQEEHMRKRRQEGKSTGRTIGVRFNPSS